MNGDAGLVRHLPSTVRGLDDPHHHGPPARGDGRRKPYGAVVALRAASLAVRPGEVHALMGANGAGKSTLVKILTGAVRPDAGTITVRGRDVRRPLAGRGAPRRHRLRLPGAGPHPGPGHPVEPAPDRDAGRAVPPLAERAGHRRPRPVEHGAHLPLATLRVIDLARALAIEPDVLMLDEMTAALPANLTERVLEVIGRQRGGDRSVIFISHRMIEIAAVCDRATVLREGETVGVVDVTEGSEERIVELMLGDIVEDMAAGRRAVGARTRREPPMSRPASRRATCARGTKLQDVSFDLHPGEVLGVVALEGQGQDELFDILAGSERPTERRAARRRLAGLVPPSGRRHPGRPRLRAGRPGRGAADAALRAREHRPAVDRAARAAGARSDRRRAPEGRRRHRAGSRSTRARRARSAGCRAATSRR